MGRVKRHRWGGFTLIEVMMAAAVLAVVLVALTGSLTGQEYMKLHARNLTLAMNDATRVMEEIRRRNTGSTGTCADGVPSVRPPAHPWGGYYGNWDAWLGAPPELWGGGGKQVQTPDSRRYELIAVTCQGDENDDGTFDTYCGTAGPTPQIGTAEWMRPDTETSFDPIQVTVAIGWVQHGRVVGGTRQGTEFQIQGQVVTNGKVTSQEQITIKTLPDMNGNRVIDSQAMLTTIITCR